MKNTKTKVKRVKRVTRLAVLPAIALSMSAAASARAGCGGVETVWCNDRYISCGNSPTMQYYCLQSPTNCNSVQCKAC